MAVREDAHRLPLSGRRVSKTLSHSGPRSANRALGPVTTVRLRLVQGLVGGAEQILDAVLREHRRDAATRARLHLADRMRFDRAAQPLREAAGGGPGRLGAGDDATLPTPPPRPAAPPA